MGDAKRRQELDPNWNKLKIEPTAIGTYELSLKNPYPFLELQGCCLVPVARLGYEEKGRGILVIPGLRLANGHPYIENVLPDNRRSQSIILLGTNR